MNHPTDEELREIEAKARERAGISSNPASSTSDLPAWLQVAIGNPPPVPDPQEVAEQARRDRFGEAGPLRSRLPDFLRNVGLKELVSRIQSMNIRDAALTWQPHRGSLLLLGDTGEGKTTAAAVIALRVIQQGVAEGGAMWELAQGMFWIRAEQLERAMRNHPMGRGESPDYAKAIGAKLLVFDECGWEKDHKLIASVLAARYDSRRLTVVTSGQTIEELRETYGDAIVRRMISFRGKPAMIATAFPEQQSVPESLPVGHNRNPKPRTEVD